MLLEKYLINEVFTVWLRGNADTQVAIVGSITVAYQGIPKNIVNEGLERLPDDMYDILERFSKMFGLDLK